MKKNITPNQKAEIINKYVSGKKMTRSDSAFIGHLNRKVVGGKVKVIMLR